MEYGKDMKIMEKMRAQSRVVDDSDRYIPAIKTKEELKAKLRPFYVIDEFMESHEMYREFQEKIYDIIKGCYERRELRKYPVKFKFYDTDTKYHTVELRHFIINLFFWEPLVELHGIKGILSDELMISDPYKDIPHLDDKVNLLIETLREYNVKNTVINYQISNVLYNLRRFSGDFSIIMGLNFDMFTIIDMYINNEEFRNIMETEIDENLQPNENEQILHQKQNELITLLKGIPENPIGIILQTGTGIKTKQLAEFLIAQGYKPTTSGDTIPLPIKNSTVLGGLKTPADLYIDGSGARKSLIMSHKVMGRAGHFGKVLTELSRTLRLSKTVDDCGTKHLVRYTITSKKFLEKFNGKYFTTSPTDFEHLRPINSKKDTDLIGKTIYVRSAATCALKNEVCSKCFGTIANLNFDIADGIGAFLSEEIAKVIEQNILSTKHLLTTDSEKITFNKGFKRFFVIESDEISPIVNESDEKNINDWVIVIDKSTLQKSDELDSEEGFNTSIRDGRFKVRNVKTGEEVVIQEENGKDIYLTDDCVQLMKKGKGVIRFKDIDDDTSLFIVTILNNELTKPLYELMNLVNSDKGGVSRNINDISQRFIDLLVESGISASAVAAEFIINRLIRSEDDIFERPDFSTYRIPKYKIVTVAKALEKNKSPLVGLSYQFVKRQLVSDDTITKKDATSYLDPFFMEKISTRKRKEHIRYVLDQKQKELHEAQRDIINYD